MNEYKRKMLISLLFLCFFQMPITYVGYPSIYKGKKLFEILRRLKNFGQGRIVYRGSEQEHPEPSFYRILLAQPEFDHECVHGRVVCEKIFRGKKRLEPYNMSAGARAPDWKLVPKDEEDIFCRWDEIIDYDFKRDAEVKPSHANLPPLMEIYLKNLLKSHNKDVEGHPFTKPLELSDMYKGEFQIEEKVEPHSMRHLLPEIYGPSHHRLTVENLPTKRWNFSSPLYQGRRKVGYKGYLGRFEGTKQYEEWKERSPSE